MSKHGAPDWSKYRRDSTTFPIEDLAELAVRLGSIVSYDRRGDVIFLDSFEDDMVHVRWASAGAGAGIGIDTDTARSGAQCVRLIAGSDGLKYAAVYKDVMPSGALTLGFELSFAHLDLNTTLDLWLTYLDRTSLWTAGIRYDIATKTFNYWADDKTWQVLAVPVHLYSHFKAWHTMKLVVDFNTQHYKRVLLDQLEFPLPLQALERSDVSYGPNFIAYVYLSNTGLLNPTTFIDDWIMTQDEP